MSGDVCLDSEDEVGEGESSVLRQVNSASGNLSFSPHPQISCSVAAPGQLLRHGNLVSDSYSAAVDLLHAVYLSKSKIERELLNHNDTSRSQERRPACSR